MKAGDFKRDEARFAIAAVAPAAAAVLLLVMLPIAGAVWLSFLRTDGVTANFVGLNNYIRIALDPIVHEVLLVNLKFLLAIPFVLLLSLLCGVLLFERIWGWQVFRVVFFIPSVLSTVVIGLVFRATFAYDGPVNRAIEVAGGTPIAFFSTGNMAIFVIILALVWAGFGYATLIILSGLSSIDRNMFAAAEIDGAGWWQKLWYITLPQLRRVIVFVSIINVLYTFTSLFGFVFVMTAGGPGYSTTTLDFLIFQRAFSSADMGSGSALAVLVFFLIGALTLLQVVLLRNDPAGSGR